MTGFVFLGR